MACIPKFENKVQNENYENANLEKNLSKVKQTRWSEALHDIKGAAEFCFTYYMYVVIILFITDLYTSAFSTYSFKNTFCVCSVSFLWFFLSSNSYYRFFYKSLLNCVRCVLKTCSRANIPCVLTCSRASVLTWSRANVPCVLMCSRANVPYLLTYLRALHAYVLTCQRALHAYVFRCQRALCAYVLMFLASERAQVPTCFACLSAHVPTCLACLLAHLLTYLKCLFAHVLMSLRA